MTGTDMEQLGVQSSVARQHHVATIMPSCSMLTIQLLMQLLHAVALIKLCVVLCWTLGRPARTCFGELTLQL